jgi:hypothetical protein
MTDLYRSDADQLPEGLGEPIEGVDDEDTSSLEAVEPWDPTKIRITTKSFSLRDVVDQIRDGDVDLSPDFQREYVWTTRQRTRLIESILLGIPLPAFYFNQSADGTYQVVDGVQRLSTIFYFMEDQHQLSKGDLEYLVDLNGLIYTQLPPASLRRFRSTQIVVHVIEPQTPDEVTSRCARACKTALLYLTTMGNGRSQRLVLLYSQARNAAKRKELRRGKSSRIDSQA